MSTPASPALPPTPRTTINRGKERAVEERARLHAFLAEALVAHVGVVAGAHPVVIPTAYAVDPDGRDEGGSLYVYGSVAAGWVTRAAGAGAEDSDDRVAPDVAARAASLAAPATVRRAG